MAGSSLRRRELNESKGFSKENVQQMQNHPKKTGGKGHLRKQAA